MDVNVTLTDDLNAFVDSQVASGRFASASDVVGEALRLLERYEQDEALKLQWLSEAYRAGTESGDAGALDAETIKAEVLAKWNARKAPSDR